MDSLKRKRLELYDAYALKLNYDMRIRPNKDRKLDIIIERNSESYDLVEDILHERENRTRIYDYRCMPGMGPSYFHFSHCSRCLKFNWPSKEFHICHKCLPCIRCSHGDQFVYHPCVVSEEYFNHSSSPRETTVTLRPCDLFHLPNLDDVEFDDDHLIDVCGLPFKLDKCRRTTCDQRSNLFDENGLKQYVVWQTWGQNEPEATEQKQNLIRWLPEEVLHDVLSLCQF